MPDVHRYRRNRVKRAAIQRARTVRARWHGLLVFAMFCGLGGIATVAAIAFLIYQNYAHDLLPPEEAIANSTIGTTIAYDRNGEFLYEYAAFGGLRNPVPLEEISPYIIDATISTEDQSFYGNPGVNFRGLARAAMENLTPFGPGWFEGSGGSSITQQLVKNVYIDAEDRFDRRVERKVKETVIAVELKRKYSDDQILEWYLNTIDYANQSFGVQAASQRYFGVSAKDLTLAQAAMLAGIPQAPGDYTPVLSDNQKRAKARQREVLNLMVRHDYITQHEANVAASEELVYETPEFFIRAPHFVSDYLPDRVQKMCEHGMFDTPGSLPCDKVVYQGGLRITTTLDMGLQRIGEGIVESIISDNESRFGGHDGAITALRNGTGEILAYVGSRDFFREDIDGQVDIISADRSHGSTMKPFTYLTAFQQGWVPSTIVRDAPLKLDVGGRQRAVNNWNFSHMGNITVRKALSESVNVPAVNTVMEVGIPEYQATAHALGITGLQRNDCGPTITLGACEIKMIDQAYAFSTLANNGNMRGIPSTENLPDGFRPLDPVAVLKIEDSEGNVLYEFKEPEEEQVVKAEHAYMVTDILSNEAIRWSSLTFGWDAASKTGTSEDFRDNVVVGYSAGPEGIAVNAWMGNADNTPMAENAFSSAGVGPMWRTFMAEAHEYLKIPKAEFEPPDTIVTSRCGGRMEVFVKDEAPTKPGVCKAPKPSNAPKPTPTPKVPTFPTRETATPTPTPEPERPPDPTPTPTPAPESTPVPEPTATPPPEEEAGDG